jgi:hypothetical protein
MTAIVVGGHSRNVGKTSVVAGLIRALGKYPWTAIKISSHRHANIPVSPQEDGSCFCEIYEEMNRAGASDTSRFLAAGACRSLWVRIEENHAEAGMRQLLPVLQSYPYVLTSNRVLGRYGPVSWLGYDTGESRTAQDVSETCGSCAVT